MHREFARGVCVGAVLMAIAVVSLYNRCLICCTAHLADADGHAMTDTSIWSSPTIVALSLPAQPESCSMAPAVHREAAAAEGPVDRAIQQLQPGSGGGSGSAGHSGRRAVQLGGAARAGAGGQPAVGDLSGAQNWASRQEVVSGAADCGSTPACRHSSMQARLAPVCTVSVSQGATATCTSVTAWCCYLCQLCITRAVGCVASASAARNVRAL